MKTLRKWTCNALATAAWAGAVVLWQLAEWLEEAAEP